MVLPLTVKSWDPFSVFFVIEFARWRPSLALARWQVAEANPKTARTVSPRNLHGFAVGGVTSTIVNDVCRTDLMIGFELRATTLGHVVRGGIPSAFDRVLATRLGAASVDRPARGAPGVLVGVLDNDIVATPLANLAGRTRPIDMMDLFLVP
jgi:6-phosphofructokinase